MSNYICLYIRNITKYYYSDECLQSSLDSYPPNSPGEFFTTWPMRIEYYDIITYFSQSEARTMPDVILYSYILLIVHKNNLLFNSNLEQKNAFFTLTGIVYILHTGTYYKDLWKSKKNLWNLYWEN